MQNLRFGASGRQRDFGRTAAQIVNDHVPGLFVLYVQQRAFQIEHGFFITVDNLQINAGLLLDFFGKFGSVLGRAAGGGGNCPILFRPVFDLVILKVRNIQCRA